jgi:hypothetical protein
MTFDAQPIRAKRLPENAVADSRFKFELPRQHGVCRPVEGWLYLAEGLPERIIIECVGIACSIVLTHTLTGERLDVGAARCNDGLGR